LTALHIERCIHPNLESRPEPHTAHNTKSTNTFPSRVLPTTQIYAPPIASIQYQDNSPFTTTTTTTTYTLPELVL
ncbi:hypothetical protein CH063_01679, partial [Colletotrichum higginsianum]